MLSTHYSHLEVEKGKYQNWKDKGYFLSGDETKTKFSMVIPPPNVTGMLHLGHAWNTTIQDIIARYKKLKDMMFYGYLEWIMQVLLHKLKLNKDFVKKVYQDMI